MLSKIRNCPLVLFTTQPYNYIANGYLDPVKERPTGVLGPSALTAGTYKVTYAYNGEVLDGITYPDGLVVRYAYDDLGRTTTTSQAGTTTQYASLTYNRDDSLRGVSYGNGLWANYTYDRMARPSTTTLKNPNKPKAQPFLSLTYNYSPTGTVASVTGQSSTTTGSTVTINEQYSYDPLKRLTHSPVTSGGTTNTLDYAYDDHGNRLRQDVQYSVPDPQCGTSLVRTTYTYDQADRLTLSSSSRPTYPSGPCSFVESDSFSYDGNGNLRTRDVTTGSGTVSWTYTWNADNRLVKVVSGTATKGAYAYDGLGRRVESIEGPATTFYAYLGTETLYNSTGTTSTDYVYADGLRIARITGTVINYYHNDILGSTRLVTSSNMNVVFSDNYQPFGQDNGTPSCTGQCESHRFTGKPVSQSTGLYYDFQRWYDPSIGRFISQDPVAGRLSRPQTLNAYTYVVNRPTNLVDPTGEDSSDDEVWTCNGICYVASPEQVRRYQEEQRLFEQAFYLTMFVYGLIIIPFIAATLAPEMVWAESICEQECETIGLGDTSIASAAENSFSLGKGGIRPVELGEQGVRLSDDYLVSRGVPRSAIQHNVYVEMPLGSRYVDTYVTEGPMGRFIMETKYSINGTPAYRTIGNLLQMQKDQLILQNQLMKAPIDYSYWFLSSSGSGPLLARLTELGIRVLPTP